MRYENQEREIRKKKNQIRYKILMLIIPVILILNMPLLLLLNSFRFSAFDFNWYEKEFAKAGSYDFGYSKETVDNAAKYLIDYLKYDKTDDPPKIEMYGSEENIHLLEVKTIMQKALILADLTLLVFIIGNLLLYLFVYNSNDRHSYKYIKYLARILGYGGIFTIALIGIILLALKFNFYSTFAVFHKLLSFGQWQFPDTSSMIRMFPGEFFYDIGVRIFLWTIVSAVILIVVSYIINRNYSKK